MQLISCSKSESNKSDDRLATNKYCNDPEAINYNSGFPGTPDNSICIFPTQVFKGGYLFYDSVLDADFKLKQIDTLNLIISATNNTKLELAGFCNGIITLTSNRYYESVIDSLHLENGGLNNVLNGQYLCGNTKDTVSGMIRKSKSDSTKITLNFTVASASGITHHQGSGTKK